MKATTTLDITVTIAGVDNEMEVEASAELTPKIEARQHRDGSWDAPEDAGVEDLSVGYYTRTLGKKTWHDITDFLSNKQIERIEGELYDSLRD